MYLTRKTSKRPDDKYSLSRMVQWRINDHTNKGLNTTIYAPEDMFPHEVILLVSTREELENMKLVVGREEYFKIGEPTPVIHVYAMPEYISKIS